MQIHFHPDTITSQRDIDATRQWLRRWGNLAGSLIILAILLSAYVGYSGAESAVRELPTETYFDMLAWCAVWFCAFLFWSGLFLAFFVVPFFILYFRTWWRVQAIDEHDWYAIQALEKAKQYPSVEHYRATVAMIRPLVAGDYELMRRLGAIADKAQRDAK